METRGREAEEENWKRKVGERVCFREESLIPCPLTKLFHPVCPARLSSVQSSNDENIGSLCFNY